MPERRQRRRRDHQPSRNHLRQKRSPGSRSEFLGFESARRPESLVRPSARRGQHHSPWTCACRRATESSIPLLKSGTRQGQRNPGTGHEYSVYSTRRIEVPQPLHNGPRVVQSRRPESRIKRVPASRYETETGVLGCSNAASSLVVLPDRTRLARLGLSGRLATNSQVNRCHRRPHSCSKVATIRSAS